MTELPKGLVSFCAPLKAIWCSVNHRTLSASSRIAEVVCQKNIHYRYLWYLSFIASHHIISGYTMSSHIIFLYRKLCSDDLHSFFISFSMNDPSATILVTSPFLSHLQGPLQDFWLFPVVLFNANTRNKHVPSYIKMHTASLIRALPSSPLEMPLERAGMGNGILLLQ